MLTLGEGKHHVDGYILQKGIPAVFLDTGNFYENLVYRSHMQYDRERDILMERRLRDDPLTLEELSGRYEVSRERIRQIEVRAFEKLQDRMRDLARDRGMTISHEG